ncbi:NADP-dependent phosphogluconate dehydrogenase [Shimia thalassica]|uniref:NADP-dependent phosphogluconate dehydrogenase n=1 Tax=Shimia thalassica TaxID=1715693 RepID=UPI0026E193A7|nr:NADP-dependent phosphogluconate dehydrogenase [Shimia thalassica]MDO6520861.1 NADP-dependent phosphogluconate dehydrogenase [Shimia thalassica]
MRQADIGVFGLGTMGSALALNFAEQGVRVAVGNRETEWVDAFLEEAGTLASHIVPTHSLESFVAELEVPRVVLFMIPSGAPVDHMIQAVLPLLSAGDTIVDAGNADFNDTRRRSTALAAQDINFVGMGVSGGEEGARNGPSMMVGGSDASWQRLQPMLEPVAAKFQDAPCVAHMGTDGAGHFVKTVHNGIEYADMQVIAEVYGLLRDGGGWEATRIAALFDRWNQGPLRSFLMEISAKVLLATDPKTGRPAVEVIVDKAGQKGTGRWTVVEALKLGQSASGIEAAVGARSWSSEKELRQRLSQALSGAETVTLPSENELEQAFAAARLLAHIQGFSVLQAASDTFDWSLDLSRIAEIWRAGCIIRSALLDDLATALREIQSGTSLLEITQFQNTLDATVPALRKVVVAGVQGGVPVPALAALLGWYDSMRQARGTTNLIQAQRDFFGHHGFERVDATGKHHGPWWDVQATS